jgi:hypothetical protein
MSWCYHPWLRPTRIFIINWALAAADWLLSRGNLPSGPGFYLEHVRKIRGALHYEISSVCPPHSGPVFRCVQPQSMTQGGAWRASAMTGEEIDAVIKGAVRTRNTADRDRTPRPMVRDRTERGQFRRRIGKLTKETVRPLCRDGSDKADVAQSGR